MKIVRIVTIEFNNPESHDEMTDLATYHNETNGPEQFGKVIGDEIKSNLESVLPNATITVEAGDG